MSSNKSNPKEAEQRQIGGMAGEARESNTISFSEQAQRSDQACEPCKSFGQKCSHLVKKQRARFYILRRCIAMLLCWHEHNDH